MTYFVVQHRGSGLVPFNIRLKAACAVPVLPDADLEAKLRTLIEEGALDPDRVTLNQVKPKFCALSHS